MDDNAKHKQARWELERIFSDGSTLSSRDAAMLRKILDAQEGESVIDAAWRVKSELEALRSKLENK